MEKTGEGELARRSGPALRLLGMFGGGTSPMGGGNDRYTLLFEDMNYRNEQ
jgi:hypothetical protein